VCDKDAYLLELVRYIHLNPVRARVVKRPEDYVWTGHLSYLGKREEDLIDEGFVLDQLGGDRSSARRRYRRFVWEGITCRHEKKYYQVKDQRYLGEDAFVERIERERKAGEEAEIKRIAAQEKAKAEEDAYRKKSEEFDALPEEERNQWLEKARATMHSNLGNAKIATRSIAISLFRGG